MKIIAPKSAIIAFTPIGLVDGMSMPDKSPNQVGKNGLKRKPKSDSVQLSVPESVSKNQNKSVKKSANLCFGGFFNANKIYTSNALHKALEFASDNGALFAAGVSLLTTVCLRPIAIFATPGVKKENKEYTCAKSIASGVIGFGLMALISTPIAQAIKKINKNPEKYLKPETISNLSLGSELLKSSKYKFSTQLFKLGADFVSAIPKALLTCALIPPIMMACFPKRNKNTQAAYPIYFKAAFDNRSNQIFKGFIGKN